MYMYAGKNLASDHTQTVKVKEAMVTNSDGVRVGRAGVLMQRDMGKKHGKAVPSGMGDDKVPIMRGQATAAAPNHNHLPVTIT